MSSQADSTPPLTLTERHTLWAAIVAGVWLRWWQLGQLAVEHHDEAVYASNLIFSSDAGGQFPGRPLYAPPLLPWLIEWTGILGSMFGFADTAWLPLLPGLVCGTALIPSVWFIARRWFSPVAGLAAAWLVALSEFHAFYSRTALTDPVLMLWLVWAVYWSWRALGDGLWRSAIIAGLLTAGAWWTKYTGWLPLAIAVAGGVADLLLSPRQERRIGQTCRVWLVMAATAGLCWLTVWRDCASVGGYAAVAANHRGYLQGWSQWGVNWLAHNAHLAFYTGVTSLLGWMVVGFLAANWPVSLTRSSSTSTQMVASRRQQLMVWGLVAVGVALSIAGVGWLAQGLAGGLAVGLALREWRRGTLSRDERRAGCLLSAWWAGLCLTTPLYQPYPRLGLPLWLAGTLGTAWCLSLLRRAAEQRPAADDRSSVPQSTPTPRLARFATSALCPWLLAGCAIAASFTTSIWESRRSALDAARDLTRQLARPGQTAAFVYADPAMFYHLSRLGVAAVPRGDLRVERLPLAEDTLLVLGSQVETLSDFRPAWEQVADRFELKSEIAVAPSSLVTRDEAAAPESTPRVVRVYSVR